MAGQRLIGDILSERRRSLGLSVERVVADTKLQRRMVEAFEDSDFDAMPPKGYAQASLASYARYLGLNPNEILRIYDDQLYDFQQEMAMGASRSSRSQRLNRSAGDGGRRSHTARSGGGEASVDRGTDSGYERSSRSREQSRGRMARSDRYPRDERDARNDRYAEDVRREREDYDGRLDRAGRDFDTGRDYAGDRARYSSRSYARPISANRAVDRGLYESGYREPSQRPDRYRSDSNGGFRGDTRRPVRDYADATERDYDARDDRRGGGDARDRRGGQRDVRDRRGGQRDVRDRGDARDDRGRTRSEYDRHGSDAPERFRREAETVSLDDGYQGGSGGTDGDDRYQPRPAFRPGQRESLSEVLYGFWDSVRSDRRTFLVIVSTVVITLVVVLAVSISSCVRSSASTDEDGGGVIQVTPVGQGTQLNPWVDLNNLPAGSQIDLVVSADSTTAPWIEAFVDDETYAEITAPGTELSWIVDASAMIRLSSIDNVTVTVNGTPVVPIADSGVYVLNLSVVGGA